jgi:hypothetical protein
MSLDPNINLNTTWLNSYDSWNDKIIEGVFTWEDMLWVDDNTYPVPQNYASKSKMVQWDRLKLTISHNWKMLYKQIDPIDRLFVKWLITKNKDKFQIVADWKTYDLLTASVTHFKWQIWDDATVIIPKWKQASFAAIESIVHKED